jgi:hypothetical protein
MASAEAVHSPSPIFDGVHFHATTHAKVASIGIFLVYFTHVSAITLWSGQRSRYSDWLRAG